MTDGGRAGNKAKLTIANRDTEDLCFKLELDSEAGLAPNIITKQLKQPYLFQDAIELVKD